MSCIDCNKDFHGDDYQTHIKCVSEDQKYGGQNYVGKANKGEVKQEKWYEQVQRAIDSIDLKDARLRSLLEQVKNYSNIPRKQQKFESFLCNSLKVRDKQLIHAAWSAISASIEKEKEKEPVKKDDLEGAETTDVVAADDENGKSPSEKTDKKRKATDGVAREKTDGGKKRKVEKDIDEPAENGSAKKRKRADPIPESGPTTEANGDSAADGAGKKKKFNWRREIKQRLHSAPENEMKLKNLRKEIVQQYKLSGKRKDHTDNELDTFFDQAITRLSDREFLQLDGKTVRVVKN